MGVCYSKENIVARIEEVKRIETKPSIIWLSPPLIKYKNERSTMCPICIGDIINDQLVYRCPFCIISIHEYCFKQLVISFESDVSRKPLCPCCRKDWSETCSEI